MSDLSVVAQFERDDSGLLYQAWQQQLLGEMGIDRWVAQTAPCVTVPNSLFDPLANPPVPVSTEFLADKKVRLKGETLTSSPSVPMVASDDGLELVKDSSNDGTTEFDNYYIDTATDVENTIDLPIAPAPTLLSKRVHLQALFANNCLLLADTQVLESHPQQYALWQQLAQYFRQPIHYHAFPLLDTVDNLPLLSQQHMANVSVAIATFEGFVHAVSLGQHHCLASLTPLPPYFDHLDQLAGVEQLSVYRLPTLSQLLNDPKQKRQLWQWLKTPKI